MSREAAALDLFEDLGDGYSHVLCATFDIDPDFLERMLLRHVPAFADADRVTILADSRQIARAYAAQRNSLANRRYVLHGIDCGLGAFHPKFLLCVGEDRAIALVGSANLTDSAWSKNLELVETFTASPDDPDPSGVIPGVLAFARTLLGRSRSRAVRRSLDEIHALAPWLDAVADPAQDSALLTTTSGALLDQVISRVHASGESVERIDILSPYHDADPGFLAALRKRLQVPSIRLFVPEGKGVPRGLADWSRTTGTFVECMAVVPSGEHHRFVHAKAFSLLGSRTEWLAFGSANATSAALLGGEPSNDELLVVRSGRRGRFSAVERLVSGVATASVVAINELPVVETTEPPQLLAHAVHLLEAERHDDRVHLFLDDEPPTDAPRARLIAGDGTTCDLPLLRRDDVWVTRAVTDVARFFGFAVRASVVGPTGALLSNQVFVLDLRDEHDVGAVVRRAVAQAKTSPLAFDLALERIRELGDQQALIEFFWFASIPGVAGLAAQYLSRSSRLPSAYVAKAPLDLNAQLDLDRALEFFWRKHLRRLRRIVERPAPESMPVALHLVAALHGGLEVQAGEVVARLRKERELTNDDWGESRTLIDNVLRRYRDLADLLGELGDTAPKVLAELKRDIAEIRRGYDAVIKWKADLDLAVRELRVRPFARPSVPACFFQGNIPLRWAEYRDSLNDSVGRLISRLAA